MAKLTRIAIMLLVACAIACAQSANQNQQPPSAPNAGGPQASSPRPDPAHQMELDLDQMDSLVNNMAAQVSFIRDTNMSILLNTNVRLWTVLIRDLRMQLQEQQKGALPEKTNSPQRH